MEKKKISRLRAHGWQIGSAADFLGLTPQEAAYVEMKASLARQLNQRRQARGLTQTQVARLVRSSQSRVAKMEKSDDTVSLDLLVQTLLALGASRVDIARAVR
jgi:predicted XRE-type DNA-binding protein